jgi:hypothetical protein
MQADWGDALLEILKLVLAGGVGGSIVALIEWQRFRRQRSEWARADAKVELRVIEASYNESRFSTRTVKDKDEELRIYKAELDGKLREWSYLVQVSVVNTTETEILALAADLEIPEFNIIEGFAPKGKDDPLVRHVSPPTAYKYNLMSKELLSLVDFPVAIPLKSATGFIFYGHHNFDFPSIVQDPPQVARFNLKLGDRSEHGLPVVFQKSDRLNIWYSWDGIRGWAPHMKKFEHIYQKPKQPATPESMDDIPF